MIKLCGFHVSNYHNKVRIALLEKGIAFEQVTQRDQCHLFVGDFDADVTMSRHGGLNTDARRGERQGKIICE